MVVDTYPADTSRFLKSQKDPFANPVGGATIQGLDANTLPDPGKRGKKQDVQRV